nr:hypothetical protein [Xenococcaceae cyanobacterium MO_188.B29]
MISAQKEPNDNDVAFRDLAMRLLRDRRLAEIETSEELQLIVGKLPDELPVEIPILESSQIIGSKVDPDKRVTIIFDTEQPKEQVIDFYRQHLLGEGWQEDDRFKRGFNYYNYAQIFYLSSKGPAITISTYKALDRPTEVSLTIQPKSRRSQYGNSRFDFREYKLIPNLFEPPNSYQKYRASGLNNDYCYSLAILKTDLDLSAVADHYIRQLEQVWQLDDRGQTSPVAWSTWTFEDQDEDEEIRTTYFLTQTQGSTSAYPTHYAYLCRALPVISFRLDISFL